MKQYTTEQRQRLLSFLQMHNDVQFAVEELAEALCDDKNISLSSIYRNLKRMVDAGMVARFATDDGHKFLYQYIGDASCSEHLHLKCKSCGRIFHMDDPSMEKLLQGAMSKNEFSIDKKMSVLFGCCKSCNS